MSFAAMTAARRGVARKVVAAVRCRYSSAIPATASTAASGPAPPAPIANSACCPAALDNGGVRPGRLFTAIASAEYPAVHAADASSIHSHSRVVNSLRNSAATRRVMTARPLAARIGGPGGEGQEDLFQPAAVTGELGERPLADQLAAADDHHLIGELLDFGQRMAGVQHGPADPGGRTQQPAEPRDSLRVQ